MRQSSYEDLQGRIRKMKTPEIEIWKNQYPDRRYAIKIDIAEFTCICPKTGLADFADFFPGKHGRMRLADIFFDGPAALARNGHSLPVHEFEGIPFGRVVACGDDDKAVGADSRGGPFGGRSGENAQISDLRAAFHKACRGRLENAGGGQAHVASECDKGRGRRHGFIFRDFAFF